MFIYLVNINEEMLESMLNQAFKKLTLMKQLRDVGKVNKSRIVKRICAILLRRDNVMIGMDIYYNGYYVMNVVFDHVLCRVGKYFWQ